MKLTLKFGAAFLLGLAAALAMYGWTTVRRETDLFWTDTRRDNLLTGKVIAAAFEQLAAQPGSNAAHDLLRRVGEIESPVRVRWLSLDSPSGDPDAPLLQAEQREALRLRNEAVVIESARGRRGGELLTYVPLAVAGERGAIEVSEPLAEAQEYTRETVLRIATTTGAMIVVCGALFALIGTRLVARPISELVEGFRRVACGDFSRPPGAPQHDELGDLAREFGVLCDDLAEARRRAAEEAARRLEALEQLRHADRLRTVGQLTAGVAHELGTPLNVVWARASMIARGEAAGEEATNCAKVIEEQSQRMTAIIRKLLEFARPRPPRRAPADLRSIIHQTFEVLGATARKRGVVLAEGEATPAWAEVDAGQLQQVLTNLVLNAIQALADGGQVTAGIRTERVRPPADVGGQEGEFLCVYVQDNGPGIAEADLPKIFEPFFTTKGVGEGTGLGLSISRGIIHEHGGWIGVENRPGQGARFNVYLPRGSSECAAAS